jgi:7,8-dihydropterin-6-yl-methyl-4-(beta-D-ribofuranosyl)aminobenzene 5'-phosphate synthase
MRFGYRVSPAWWPVLGLLSPIIIPWMVNKWLRFRSGQRETEERNARRLERARPLDLPVLQSMEITAVVEQKHEEGFLGDPAVSYLIGTDRGSLLMDIGFGSERPAFGHNAGRLGLTAAKVEALVISHLHLDHMGGMRAQRSRRISLPVEIGDDLDGAGVSRRPCYVPDTCAADGLELRVVDAPMLLAAGLGTTGPLARMLFFFGLTEEQAIIARLEGKGLVVLTGCGHPTVEVILQMVRRICDEPLYAIVGGLHFPISHSRGRKLGIELQQLFGTGKPAWQRIGDADLDRTIDELNEAAPKRVLLSAHDTCDYALDRLAAELDAEVETLRAGATYSL